jgi:hypothetical protein
MPFLRLPNFVSAPQSSIQNLASITASGTSAMGMQAERCACYPEETKPNQTNFLEI